MQDMHPIIQPTLVVPLARPEDRHSLNRTAVNSLLVIARDSVFHQFEDASKPVACDVRIVPVGDGSEAAVVVFQLADLQLRVVAAYGNPVFSRWLHDCWQSGCLTLVLSTVGGELGRMLEFPLQATLCVPAPRPGRPVVPTADSGAVHRLLHVYLSQPQAWPSLLPGVAVREVELAEH
ncbi:hypothetical protein [Derxia lacustris]|uniref:hypothetical protein n=1 Tax=Derxia lacustris TaxID=764842 RepID=UPI00111C370F|nr:hypothetical protein [Derxia lacustris]